MDFSSLTEFPPLSQVMSPSETTRNDEREWAEAMAAAYMAGAQEASSAAPQNKRRHADATDQPPGARRAPWELGSTMTVGNSLEAAKNRLSFRTLDTGRAEDYDSWRHAVKAEIVASAADPGRAVEYLAAIEQPQAYPDDALYSAVQSDGGLRALDARVYGAVLEALQGKMRGAVEARIRAQGHPYAGGLALRRLDAFFQAGAQRRKAVATRDLLVLTPRGHGAVAMEEFLANYRLLLQQAGADNVGADAQVDILRRAAEDHPRLTSVWAAWQHGGSHDPNRLLECLEDATARAVHGTPGPRPTATAWAAMDDAQEWSAGAEKTESTRDGADGPAMQDRRQQWAPAPAGRRAAYGVAQPTRDAATQLRKKCFGCGRIGHLQRDCRASGARQGAGATHSNEDTQKELLRTMADLLAELRAARNGESARKPKQ